MVVFFSKNMEHRFSGKILNYFIHVFLKISGQLSGHNWNLVILEPKKAIFPCNSIEPLLFEPTPVKHRARRTFLKVNRVFQKLKNPRQNRHLVSKAEHVTLEIAPLVVHLF